MPVRKRVVADMAGLYSVQWFNSRAVGRLVTPTTLQVIAINLVTPCTQCHSLAVSEPAVDVPFTVSLGNDHEMKAFYVPELNSNALHVTESEADLSDAVNLLMKEAARAQLVRVINLMALPRPYAIYSSPVFAISLGMVSRAPAEEVNRLLPACLLRQD